jgi:hypothetical protein
LSISAAKSPLIEPPMTKARLWARCCGIRTSSLTGEIICHYSHDFDIVAIIAGRNAMTLTGLGSPGCPGTSIVLAADRVGE